MNRHHSSHDNYRKSNNYHQNSDDSEITSGLGKLVDIIKTDKVLEEIVSKAGIWVAANSWSTRKSAGAST